MSFFVESAFKMQLYRVSQKNVSAIFGKVNDNLICAHLHRLPTRKFEIKKMYQTPRKNNTLNYGTFSAI